MKAWNPTKAELSEQTLAWAEFLYDEYMSVKHKQLLLTDKNTTISSTNKEGMS